MTTVRALLDDLYEGKRTLDEVAVEFAKRDFPAPTPPTPAQAWGEADDDAPDDDSFALVSASTRLTPEQYATLAAAAAA